ncbi:LytR C-terminal domain-containing protein [Aromatoleum toluclasticum]|uniref:LytR C-terminal domain-containing protein n=1 Tax=Aromatoleum toluclasticum TaxID=92003 RepID=UPI001D17FDCF|nr:LytR C-terminal domain-containing protein [Aromatoleum toluclasticum]MCC4115652.1 LytR C-terminal domain-containing protein [Aromatoleum toluclasticum]
MTPRGVTMTTNKIVFALKPVLAAMVLGACSTAPTMPPKAWSVDPVLEIQHSGRDADTYYQLGRYHDGQDRLGVAIAAYRVAVAANVQHGAAWNALGTALAKSGKLAEAIDAFEKAAAITPDASHVQNNLGYALMLAGRDRDAVVPLRRAVDLDRDNRHAWRNLETAYARTGEREQAMVAKGFADVGQAPAAAPQPPAPATQAVAANGNQAQTGSVLVQLADNVFELRAPTLSRTETVAEAATIIKAAVAPAASAPAAVVYPVRTAGETVRTSALTPEPRTPAPARSVTPDPSITPARSAASTLATTQVPTAVAVPTAVTVPTTVAVPAAAAVPAAVSLPASVTAPAAVMVPAAIAIPAPQKPQLIARIIRYEITNGQGGEGLARRLAALLGREGGERPRLTNHKPFDQMLSYVEYREGYREAAAAFAKRLPFRAELRAAPANLVVTDVRLMLGKDLNISDACSALGLCARYARKAAPAPQAQKGGFTRTNEETRQEQRRTSDPVY